jgi:hypothetical protein
MPVIMIFAALTFLLSACAAPPPVEDRFLTKEEDAAIAERCPDKNCVVVPVPVWEEILRRLKAAMGRNA